MDIEKYRLTDEKGYLDAYLEELGWLIPKDGMQYAWLKQLIRRVANAQLEAVRPAIEEAKKEVSEEIKSRLYP